MVCGGDLDLMTRTSSKLTRLEEWVFYLEMIHGRTTTRWQDYEHNYGHYQNGLGRIFKEKLGLVISARNRWPKHASYQDFIFRDELWNRHFKPNSGIRPQ
jgi:hypothetical protein